MKSKEEDQDQTVSRHRHLESHTRQPGKDAGWARSIPGKHSAATGSSPSVYRFLDVDILHAMGVEYLHPEGNHDSTLPEPHRAAPGHARPAHTPDASLGPAARLWHQPGDSHSLGRHP